LDELKAAIREAAQKGLKVRAVGSGHSWSQLGLDPRQGAIVLTDRLNRVLDIDKAAGRVTVEGGIKLHDLNKELFRNGLALANLGDIDRQSIAGAVSTDTHGSGGHLGGFGDFVEGVTLVTADGEAYEVPETELPAARVSLGRLGVLYALRLKVVPAFHVKHVGEIVDVREEKDQLPRLLQENRNIEYWYFPYTGKADRVVRNEIPPRKTRCYNLRYLQIAIGAVWADLNGRFFPSRLPTLFDRAMKLRSLRPDVRYGPSHEIFPSLAQSTVDLIKTYTMEYQFDLDDLWVCLDEFDESVETARRKGVYISLPIHIRFTQKSRRSLLSHFDYDITASFSVNFSRNYEGAHVWLPDLERRLLRRGAKTHWGKIYYREPEIPPEFEEIRKRLDPGGMFLNEQKPYRPSPGAFG
jgi:L-gulonolactone oxidase